MARHDRATKVRVAANFQRNLDEIEAFLSAAGNDLGFAALLEKLFRDLIPNLEHFPDLGFDFLSRPAETLEARNAMARVRALCGAGASIREYVFEDYVILYQRQKKVVVLLAIRHHRQLSFDFAGHW